MNNKGFTTIDLIVSVGIMAILVTIALVSLQSIRKTEELEAAISQTKNFLTTARTLSFGGKLVDGQDQVPGFGVRFSLQDPEKIITYYSHEETGAYVSGNELSHSPAVFKNISLVSLCYLAGNAVNQPPCGPGWQQIDSFADLTFTGSGIMLFNTDLTVDQADFIGGGFVHQKTQRRFYFYVAVNGGLILVEKL